MRIFIQALDYDMWSIIVNELYIPTKLIDGVSLAKSGGEWDKFDRKWLNSMLKL